MKGVVVITGANRGLGLSLADIFLRSGYRVLALNRTESSGSSGLKENYAENFQSYQVDVVDEESIRLAAMSIADQEQGVDILINNAAVHSSNQATTQLEPPNIEHLDFTNIETDLAVNSIGPLKLIKHFLPLVRSGSSKLIVNISSEAGSISTAWRTNVFGYCMSKAALNMASKILQNYLMEEGIKVLAIHPGWFSSDMGGQAAPISPDIAAQQVVNTILKEWSIEDPIFVSAEDGSKMEW